MFKRIPGNRTRDKIQWAEELAHSGSYTVTCGPKTGLVYPERPGIE